MRILEKLKKKLEQRECDHDFTKDEELGWGPIEVIESDTCRKCNAVRTKK